MRDANTVENESSHTIGKSISFGHEAFPQPRFLLQDRNKRRGSIAGCGHKGGGASPIQRPGLARSGSYINKKTRLETIQEITETNEEKIIACTDIKPVIINYGYKAIMSARTVSEYISVFSLLAEKCYKILYDYFFRMKREGLKFFCALYFANLPRVISLVCQQYHNSLRSNIEKCKDFRHYKEDVESSKNEDYAKALCIINNLKTYLPENRKYRYSNERLYILGPVISSFFDIKVMNLSKYEFNDEVFFESENKISAFLLPSEVNSHLLKKITKMIDDILTRLSFFQEEIVSLRKLRDRYYVFSIFINVYIFFLSWFYSSVAEKCQAISSMKLDILDDKHKVPEIVMVIDAYLKNKDVCRHRHSVTRFFNFFYNTKTRTEIELESIRTMLLSEETVCEELSVLSAGLPKSPRG